MPERIHVTTERCPNCGYATVAQGLLKKKQGNHLLVRWCLMCPWGYDSHAPKGGTQQ